MSNRRSLYWIASALAIALVCVATSQAQRQGQGRGGRGGFGFGGPGGGGFGADSLMLLSNEKVQSELDLTAEQKDGVKKLSDERQAQMREAFSGAQDLSPEERRERFAEMREKMQKQAAETKEKVAKLLLPPQAERLEQLRIQRMGAGALSDEAVAKSLNVSEDQKKQLADIRQANFEKMGELFGRGGRRGGAGDETEADREARQQKMTELRKDLTDKSLAVLTAEQKAQFEKMQGDKFEFPADMGFGGGRGRFGAGGGGQGGGRQRRGGNQGNQGNQ